MFIPATTTPTTNSNSNSSQAPSDQPTFPSHITGSQHPHKHHCPPPLRVALSSAHLPPSTAASCHHRLRTSCRRCCRCHAIVATIAANPRPHDNHSYRGRACQHKPASQHQPCLVANTSRVVSHRSVTIVVPSLSMITSEGIWQGCDRVLNT